MANPIYDYFGGNPVSVIMEASTAFDGSAYPNGTVGDIKPGVVKFTPAANCGLLNFHRRPLLIESVMCSAGTNVAATIIYPDGDEVSVGAASDANPLIKQFVLPFGAALKLVGTAGKVSIVALEYVPGNVL